MLPAQAGWARVTDRVAVEIGLILLQLSHFEGIDKVAQFGRCVHIFPLFS